MTKALAALIHRLDTYDCITEADPEVSAEDAAALWRLGWFRCYSCVHWYPAEDHYRNNCCLYCADPIEEGDWVDGTPPEHLGQVLPMEHLEPLVIFAATQGLELRSRWREGMEEPCALGYTAPGEDFLAEHTAKDWYETIRAVRLALMTRCANG